MYVPAKMRRWKQNVGNIISYLKLQVLTVTTQHYEVQWSSTDLSKEPAASILQFFYPEESNSKFLQNVSSSTRLYCITSHKTVTFIVLEE
jgi:hypothetical protein